MYFTTPLFVTIELCEITSELKALFCVGYFDSIHLNLRRMLPRRIQHFTDHDKNLIRLDSTRFDSPSGYPLDRRAN